MQQQKKITLALKEILRSRNMRYAEIAHWLKLSESSVKRLFSQQTLSLPQIEIICRELRINFVELVQIANEGHRRAQTLSLAQEREMAAEPELFRLFYLLFRKWKTSQIQAAWNIPEATLVQLLIRLDHIGLIELLPGHKVRLLVSSRLKWIADGPIAKLFRNDVTQNFLADFNENHPEHNLYFIPCELSRDGAIRTRKLLKEAAVELQEIADHEAKLHKATSKGHGVLLAIKPWVHPLFVAESQPLAHPKVSSEKKLQTRRKNLHKKKV